MGLVSFTIYVSLFSTSADAQFKDFLNKLGKDLESVIEGKGRSSDNTYYDDQTSRSPSNTSNQMLILEAQKELQRLGYDVIADGKYGPGTRRAIIQFERSTGRQTFGKITPEIVGALKRIHAPTYVKKQNKTSQPNIVLETQKELNRLGYNIVVDGQDGPGTRKAIRSFQQEKGFDVTGKVSQNLLNQMRVLNSQASPSNNEINTENQSIKNVNDYSKREILEWYRSSEEYSRHAIIEIKYRPNLIPTDGRRLLAFGNRYFKGLFKGLNGKEETDFEIHRNKEKWIQDIAYLASFVPQSFRGYKRLSTREGYDFERKGYPFEIRIGGVKEITRDYFWEEAKFTVFDKSYKSDLLNVSPEDAEAYIKRFQPKGRRHIEYGVLYSYDVIGMYQAYTGKENSWRVKAKLTSAQIGINLGIKIGRNPSRSSGDKSEIVILNLDIPNLNNTDVSLEDPIVRFNNKKNKEYADRELKHKKSQQKKKEKTKERRANEEKAKKEKKQKYLAEKSREIQIKNYQKKINQCGQKYNYVPENVTCREEICNQIGTLLDDPYAQNLKSDCRRNQNILTTFWEERERECLNWLQRFDHKSLRQMNKTEHVRFLNTCRTTSPRGVSRFDILEVQLGINLFEGENSIKRQVGGNGYHETFSETTPYNNAKLVYSRNGNSGLAVFSASEKDLVSGISRRLYVKDHKLIFNQLKARLEEKYGQHSFSPRKNTLMWFQNKETNIELCSQTIQDITPISGWVEQWYEDGQQYNSLTKNLPDVRHVLAYTPKSKDEIEVYKECGPILVVLADIKTGFVDNFSMVLFDPAYMTSQPPFLFEDDIRNNKTENKIKF